MRSETSIEAGFRTWHFFVLASLAAATAAVLLSPPTAPARLVLMSMAIGAAGLTAGALYRTLAPLVDRQDDVVVEPLGQRARAVLEKEMALALRAIKELEFDRAMGKVAPADYVEMMGRLRARAAGVIARLDEDARRNREPNGRRRRSAPTTPARLAKE
ncbi:MAG TPA: hypothetical protein VHI98_17170 [Vicinamibacterales bacterium]|nr:hypothetical protein [Vicinamibacterales bacterium]